MAIDTRAKRASSIGAARPWMVQLPVPDGSITSASDRQQVAYRYVGVLAAPAVFVEAARIFAVWEAAGNPTAVME